MDSTLAQLEKGATIETLVRVGEDHHIAICLLEISIKNPLVPSSSISISLGSFWPYFSAFFLSTISKRPRFPRHTFVWRIYMTYFFRSLSCLVRCLLESKASINRAYRGYGAWVPSTVTGVQR